MNATKGWVLVIGILALFATAAILTTLAVNRTVQNTLRPLTQGSNNLQTQVAKVLDPTPTVLPDPVTIIQEIRTLARLETIQYTVEKVITAQEAQGSFAFLFGDRILFVAHGTVVAGVDLSKIGPGDISIQSDVVTIHLPAAEIFATTLDNQKSYIYNRTTGVLTRGDVNLETTARQAAENEIKNAALQDGILSQAQTNAQNYITSLVQRFGYRQVIILEPTAVPVDIEAP